MVGGIIDSVVHREDRIIVVVEGTGCESGQKLCVDLETPIAMPRKGDQIWWQDRMAYWTPKLPKVIVQDIPLKRIGCSYPA